MGPGPDLARASDPELVTAARSGDPSAFAVLLRRHAARFADLAAAPEGERALVRLGVRAMRELPRLAPDRAAADWFDDLAAAERRRHGGGDRPAPARAPGTDVDPRDWLDRWWSGLSMRWPNGRLRRPIPGWARAAIAAAVIVAVGIVGTSALLRERPAPPLIAQVQAYAEPAPGDDFAPEDDTDPGDLPVFSLPDEPTDEAPTGPTPPATDGTPPDGTGPEPGTDAGASAPPDDGDGGGGSETG